MAQSGDSIDKYSTARVGFPQAFTMVVGTVIGSQVFFKASAVTEYTNSVSMGMFAWLLGGLVTLCAGLTVAELSAMYPESGGLMNYIGHAYGPFWGFLSGWGQTVVYFPANMASIGLSFGTQFVYLFDWNKSYIPIIAFVTVLSLIIINIWDVDMAGQVSNVTLFMKMVPFAAIILFGFTQKQQPGFSFFPIKAGPHVDPVVGMGQALLATMFAYDGWIHVGNLAGDMKDTKHDLPRAMTAGILFIMVVYILVNAVFYWVEPLSAIKGNLTIASDVASKIFGTFGGKLLTIGILAADYGSLDGFIMTGMRVPFVMSTKGMWPLSKKEDYKLHTPRILYLGALFEFLIATFMIFAWNFNTVSNILTFVIWLFYTMAFAAVIKLRHTQPDVERPYKTPLYPIIPLIAFGFGMYILIDTFITQNKLSMMGILITATGIPLYLYLKKRNKERAAN